jgi:predicted DNA-binding protein (MmcQ/YjbR family)
MKALSQKTQLFALFSSQEKYKSINLRNSPTSSAEYKGNSLLEGTQ